LDGKNSSEITVLLSARQQDVEIGDLYKNPKHYEKVDYSLKYTSI